MCNFYGGITMERKQKQKTEKLKIASERSRIFGGVEVSPPANLFNSIFPKKSKKIINRENVKK